MRHAAKLIKYWLLILVAVGFAYFAVKNQERVAVGLNPFFEHISLPVYLWMLASFVFGSMFTGIILGLEIFQKSRTIRTLRRDLPVRAPTPPSIPPVKPT